MWLRNSKWKLSDEAPGPDLVPSALAPSDVSGTLCLLWGLKAMQCPACGSTTGSERPERTAQGYRRYRCANCDKQFNERSTGVLGLKSTVSATRYCRGYDELRNFLRCRSRMREHVPAAVRRWWHMRKTAIVLAVLATA